MKKLRKNKNMQSVISVNTNILLRRFRLKFLIVSKLEVKGEGNTPLSKLLLEVKEQMLFLYS
jgi:glutathione peroxidase-family protein